MVNLFKDEKFTSHSGIELSYKIDCDALTLEDWNTLARIVNDKLISANVAFKSVEGIPSGGLKFAKALEKYADPDAHRVLIVDDVMTTGKSFDKHRNGRSYNDILGICVFSRTRKYPGWISPMWIVANNFMEGFKK